MCAKDEFMHDVRDLERAIASVDLLRSAIRLTLADLHAPVAAGGGPGKAEIRLRAALTATQDDRGRT